MSGVANAFLGPISGVVFFPLAFYYLVKMFEISKFELG